MSYTTILGISIGMGLSGSRHDIYHVDMDRRLRGIKAGSLVKGILSVLLFVVAVATTMYLFYGRYLLGLVRYFDMDEYAYLYWTSHFVGGLVPFKDFFAIVPSGFLWLLSPLFLSGTGGAHVLASSRTVSFLLFCVLNVAAAAVFFRVRKSWLFIFAPLFLVSLPLPSDKFLEVRPDTFAIALAWIGIYFQTVLLRMDPVSGIRIPMFLSGFAYGASIIVMQKTAPHVAIATMVLCVWSVYTSHIAREPLGASIRRIIPFICGLCIFPLIFLFWIIPHVSPNDLWYALYRAPVESYRLAERYFIRPDFYFEPNDVYYGTYGYTVGNVFNQVLWVVAVLVASFRMFTPFVPAGKGGIWVEALLAVSFISQYIGYIHFIPLKHSQYLMFPAVFVAWYCADALFLVWSAFVRGMKGMLVFAVCITLVLAVSVMSNRSVDGPKTYWTNDADIIFLNRVLSTVPRNEPIFDMIGLTMYFPQAYYASCLPIGQAAEYMSRKPPPVVNSLVRSDTKFIYQGPQKRIGTLTLDDQKYIFEKFTPVGDGRLLIRNDVLVRYRASFE